MDDLTLKRSVIELLPQLSAEAVVVLVYLVDRSHVQKELGIGLTAKELARSCGIAPTSVARAMRELIVFDLIAITEKPKYLEVTVKDTVTSDGGPIPFTYNDTDDTKIAKLETEVRRLRLQSERDRTGTMSGLVDVSEGEERALYQEIERRGFGLTPNEANILGKCVQKFGPDRTRNTYRRMKSRPNPIIATYAALQNGIMGKGAQQVESEPFKKVYYKDLD